MRSNKDIEIDTLTDIGIGFLVAHDECWPFESVYLNG